ncbi:hypothetical protein BDF21DRAFT_483612, partial [Thamnidium elegans]
RLPHNSCVKEKYKSILTTKIITTYRGIRHIIFHAKIFVSFYILQHQNESVPPGIFKRQFWNTICQLVNDRIPTSNAPFPQNLLSTWDQFKNENPSVTLLAGASDCLVEACAEIATSYTNSISETFETKVSYKLQTKFVVTIDIQSIFVYFTWGVNPKLVKDVTKYCYQFGCQGSPVRPNNNALMETIKEQITTFYLPLMNLLNSKATLSILSKICSVSPPRPIKTGRRASIP